MISPEELADAIQRYQTQQIDLRELCLMMVAHGARASAGLVTGPVTGPLPQPSTFGTRPASSSAIEMLASLPPMRPPQPPPRVPPPIPLQKIPSIPPPSVPAPRLSPAKPPEPAPRLSQSPLGAFCDQRNIQSRLPPLADQPEGQGDPQALIQWVSAGGQLGAGGSGRVVAAYDRDLQRTMALKLLHPRVQEDPLQVQAFIEEAIITGGLEHPNIVPVHSLGYSAEWGPYYTMKRLRGKPLNQILRGLRMDDPETSQRFSMLRLLGCFVEVCQAIAFAHDHGVIHCDIKPSNIMVGEYGEVMVVDWGLARLLGARGRQQARSALWSGTPAYMPPEQLTGTLADLDVQTDVWSLGAVLYEMLTLTVPFMGEQMEETMKKLLTDPVELPTVRAPDRLIPEELERICMRGLSRDRRQRYQSVQSMLRDVEAYLEGSREARRRAEHSQRALEQAQKQLGRLQKAEQSLDELQRALEDSPDVSVQYTAAQEDLVLAYTNAAAILERALRLDAQHGGLLGAASDLYWRVFQRIYPGRVRPSALLCERGLELLTGLSQRAFGAIVQAGRGEEGRALARQVGVGGAEDPWLGAVLRLCSESADGGALGAGALPPGLAEVVNRIKLLKSVSLFQSMPAFELLPIAEACEVVDFGKDEVIFRKGQPGDALFVVVSGSVAIVRDGATLTALGATACFGEIAVLDESTRTADAVCEKPSRVLRLTASSFRKTIAEHGEIGLSVTRVLVQRLRAATDREASLRNSIKLP